MATGPKGLAGSQPPNLPTPGLRARKQRNLLALSWDWKAAAEEKLRGVSQGEERCNRHLKVLREAPQAKEKGDVPWTIQMLRNFSEAPRVASPDWRLEELPPEATPDSGHSCLVAAAKSLPLPRPQFPHLIGTGWLSSF